MEGMRKIASAYYERSDESGKRAAQEFFQQLDVDGDRKVSLQELKRCIPPSISNERVFSQLDVNGDGILDFDEVLVVYYIINKTELMVCCGCWELLSGTYFGCKLCADDGIAYSLCSGCYRNCNVTLTHDHPYSCLVDNHSLLAQFRLAKINLDRQGSTGDEKERRKGEMEELLAIVKAHYQGESSNVQDLAHQFFQSMDTDNDGKVDLSEFLEFMRHEGHLHPQMQTPDFFNELDHDGNGILDFFEVMRLYYIMKSGRPFCDGTCAKFIPGIFFSCVDCFTTSKTTFNVCLSCYQSRKYSHIHNQFRDNYQLLEATRNSVMTMATPPNTSNNATTHFSQFPSQTPYYTPFQPPNYSNPLALALPAQPHKWDNVKVALHALNIALQIASLSGACTIM